VGEGIQAKRRSAAVVIDHLTPPVNKYALIWNFTIWQST
jgi:cobalamin biosynthesis Mg chelatase CobN